MAEKVYNWTDDPMVSGVADCNTDVVNDCLMHLKYENTTDAIQNMYTTGQVETQTRGFTQLKAMRHSTFDLSKFEVVGSPTITDDGVASGFSTSNYLRKIFSTPIDIRTQTIVIKQRVVFKGYCIPLYTNSDYWRIRWELSSQDLAIRFSTGSVGSGDFTRRISLDEEITIITTLHSGNITAKIYDSNNSLLSEIISSYSSDSADFYNIYSLALGGCYNAQAYADNYIDLKQFSITVDGKEVFSGNKTGLDVIKPDNYTVVGSSVISDVGVASGFSSLSGNSSYIALPIFQLGQSNSWKIHISFNTSDLFNLPTEWIFVTSYASFFGGISLGIEGGANLRIRFASTASSTGDLVDKSFIKIIKPNTKYEVIVEFTGTTYNISYKIDNNEWVIYTTQSTTKLYNDLNFSRLGYRSNSSVEEGFSGSIDLNAFKIYVDGNLVYQPCLKIPYTQSKTGSKIVDAVYRDRVIDLYEQQGQVGYYTIDESNKNFTLPMGEIYGMIEEKAVQIDEVRKSKVDKSELAEIYPVVETYVNGTSGYRIWSDGYCEQWGRVTVGNKSSVTVTLLKAYSNLNYKAIAISIGAMNMSASLPQNGQVQSIDSTSQITVCNGETQRTVQWETGGYLAEGWNNEGI